MARAAQTDAAAAAARAINLDARQDAYHAQGHYVFALAAARQQLAAGGLAGAAPLTACESSFNFGRAWLQRSFRFALELMLETFVADRAASSFPTCFAPCAHALHHAAQCANVRPCMLYYSLYPRARPRASRARRTAVASSG